MEILSTILVAVDESSYADEALDCAIDLAKKYESTLTIIHIVPESLVRFGLIEYVTHKIEEYGKRILDEGKEPEWQE